MMETAENANIKKGIKISLSNSHSIEILLSYQNCMYEECEMSSIYVRYSNYIGDAKNHIHSRQSLVSIDLTLDIVICGNARQAELPCHLTCTS